MCAKVNGSIDTAKPTPPQPTTKRNKVAIVITVLAVTILAAATAWAAYGIFAHAAATGGKLAVIYSGVPQAVLITTCAVGTIGILALIVYSAATRCFRKTIQPRVNQDDGKGTDTANVPVGKKPPQDSNQINDLNFHANTILWKANETPEFVKLRKEVQTGLEKKLANCLDASLGCPWGKKYEDAMGDMTVGEFVQSKWLLVHYRQSFEAATTDSSNPGHKTTQQIVVEVSEFLEKHVVKAEASSSSTGTDVDELPPAEPTHTPSAPVPGETGLAGVRETGTTDATVSAAAEAQETVIEDIVQQVHSKILSFNERLLQLDKMHEPMMVGLYINSEAFKKNISAHFHEVLETGQSETLHDLIKRITDGKLGRAEVINHLVQFLEEECESHHERVQQQKMLARLADRSAHFEGLDYSVDHGEGGINISLESNRVGIEKQVEGVIEKAGTHLAHVVPKGMTFSDLVDRHLPDEAQDKPLSNDQATSIAWKIIFEGQNIIGLQHAVNNRLQNNETFDVEDIDTLLAAVGHSLSEKALGSDEFRTIADNVLRITRQQKQAFQSNRSY